MATMNIGAVTTPSLTADQVLNTTRTVRKRLDLSRPVPMDLSRSASAWPSRRRSDRIFYTRTS